MRVRFVSSDPLSVLDGELLKLLTARFRHPDASRFELFAHDDRVHAALQICELEVSIHRLLIRQTPRHALLPDNDIAPGRQELRVGLTAHERLELGLFDEA